MNCHVDEWYFFSLSNSHSESVYYYYLLLVKNLESELTQNDSLIFMHKINNILKSLSINIVAYRQFIQKGSTKEMRIMNLQNVL
jgi:hypothetical protein